MRSSQKSIDQLIKEEVSSKARYIRDYQQPVWPGEQSGITIGIGYDVGHQTKEKVRADWTGLIPQPMVEELVRVTGLKGAAAKAQLAKARRIVSVPWEAAKSVFYNVDIPRWESIVLRAIPAAKNLPPDCFGVILGLTYNRGASYNKVGEKNNDRYREMRAVKAAITAGRYDEVPGHIRSMKRLWPGVKGLIARRETEAKMFEEGLRSRAEPLYAEPEYDGVTNTATGDDRTTDIDIPAYEAPTDTPPDMNVQPLRGAYSLDLEVLQGKLISLRYFEIGDADGRFGGKTFAGVNAFLLDRGVSSDGIMDANGFTSGTAWRTVTAEVSAALAQKWSRPIADTRAHATPAVVGKKVEAVRQTWYQKLWAWVLGIPATIAAAFKSIAGDDPSSWIGTAKSYMGMVPTEIYFLGVVGVAIAIYISASRAQNATVRDYQEGRIN